MKNYEAFCRLRQVRATSPSYSAPKKAAPKAATQPTKPRPEPKSRERAAVMLACGLRDRGGLSLERHAVLLAKRLSPEGLIVK